ncbi:MAG: alpha/beta fold hydrolase [Betaproteobacteria bacterium]|nr:alpha/beta fold hydrolase [Betaproteobacteria bacterium]
MNDYRAPHWLPGGHAQTIYAALNRPPMPAYTRERWDTPDGDFVDLDWAGPREAQNTLLLFHGLEGGSGSHYARAIVAQAAQAGWRCAVAHFRGCSGEPNRLARAYHSGDAEEIDWIVRRVHAASAAQASRSGLPPPRLHLAAVSLGGNATLKWLGERGGEAAGLVHRAAAISAPFDLAAAGRVLERGFNMVYTRMFLATMKRAAAAKLARFPGIFDARAMQAARTLYEFDNAVTAPLHGFRDTDDYWSRASSWPLLAGIRVPTLVLNARNDPFMPAQSLERARGASSDVILEFPEQGGHVGFPSGLLPGGRHWLAARLMEFYTS